LDTHSRSPDHARLDTPWNSFTADDRSLVCTLWVDLIVQVQDAKQGRVRRFVKMGGRSQRWRGVGQMHGEEARANLDRAIAQQLPVFGYEAEPNAAALKKGVRSVKHFYLDRVHQLKPWIGLSFDALDRELHVQDAFRRNDLVGADDPNLPPTVFELVELSAQAPGRAAVESTNGEDPGEEDELAQDLIGGKTADEYARLALPVLVEHVLRQTDDVLVPMTYRRLAEHIGRRNKHGDPWARGLGHVLGRVTALIDSVRAQLPEEPPFLTSVVVLSSGPNAGLPGKGVGGRWPGYESLSRDDKEAKVSAEHLRVLQFGSRWNVVLRLLGMKEIAPPVDSDGRAAKHGWGGGESEAHKALKQYVLGHPELVGAASDWAAQEEFALRSADELDVMFRSNRIWIGVEVKSRVSDGNPSDYERGIYQVVKYRAVLKAQARVDRPHDPPDVQVVLVLERQLPAEYRGVADALGVKVIERVSVEADTGKHK
jgi:hypothetical protein